MRNIIYNYLDIYNIRNQNLFGIIYCSCLKAIHLSLTDAKRFYPDFDQWFYNKVVPGLNSDRQIILEIINKRVAGISILKNSNEKKISTIKVTNNFQGQKIGYKLLHRSFEVLNTEKPFCTVSEEKFLEFKKIFDYHGFKLTSVHENYYRQGKKEYFFNEK